MPTYEYFCDACRESCEIFQSITEPAAEVCPNCGAKKLRKRISGGVGVIFKGSGFYCTDYKGKNASSPSTASSGCSTKSK